MRGTCIEPPAAKWKDGCFPRPDNVRHDIVLGHDPHGVERHFPQAHSIPAEAHPMCAATPLAQSAVTFRLLIH